MTIQEQLIIAIWIAILSGMAYTQNIQTIESAKDAKINIQQNIKNQQDQYNQVSDILKNNNN